MCPTVNDGALDSDPVCTLAVVYDPSGGWIDSPADAYKTDASLNGSAISGGSDGFRICIWCEGDDPVRE